MKKERMAMRTTWCLAAAAVLLSLTGCGKFFPFFPDDAASYTLEYNTLDVNKDILMITFPIEFAEGTEGAPQCADLQEESVQDLVYSFALHSLPPQTKPSIRLPLLCGAVTCTLGDVASCTIRCTTECEKGFFPKTENIEVFLSLTWNYSDSKKAEIREKLRQARGRIGANNSSPDPVFDDVVVYSGVFDLNSAQDVTPSDTDHDGVADDDDNCLDTANTDQNDVDNDGVGDACAVKIESGSTAPSEPVGSQGPQGTMEDTTNPGCTMIAGAGAVADPIALILIGFTLLPLSIRKKRPSLSKQRGEEKENPTQDIQREANMKSGKKKWSLAVVGMIVAVFGLALVACDDGGSGKITTDQTRDETPTVQPVADPAVPSDIADRLADLEEEIRAKTTDTASKDAAVAALEAQIAELEKDLEAEGDAREKAESELKEKLAEAQKEAQEATEKLQQAVAEIERLKAEAVQTETEAVDQTATRKEETTNDDTATQELPESIQITVNFAAFYDLNESSEEEDPFVQFPWRNSASNSCIEPLRQQMRATELPIPTLKIPNEDGKLLEKDQWLCILFFKSAKRRNVPLNCEGNCFTRVKNEWVAGADARTCYHVGDESLNEGRELWVDRNTIDKLEDIANVYLLAHDRDVWDFDTILIDSISIDTDTKTANVPPPVRFGSSGFELFDLGTVQWTDKD